VAAPCSPTCRSVYPTRPRDPSATSTSPLRRTPPNVNVFRGFQEAAVLVAAGVDEEMAGVEGEEAVTAGFPVAKAATASVFLRMMT
jgi:hypothetical protein